MNSAIVIGTMEETPHLLRSLFEGVGHKEALWKPEPERFSIAEILEHLSHVEGHAFRLRIDKMIALDNPEVELYDQEALAAAGAYSLNDPDESFAHFEEQREDNLEFLRSLKPDVWNRTAVHPQFGTFTVSQLANEWAFHDLGHIRQVAEIVRVVLFYRGMGPLRTQYTVNP